MGLEQASNMGSIDDILNMLQLQGVLFYFVLPFIAALGIVYIVRSVKNKTKKKVNNEIQNKEEQIKVKQTYTIKNKGHKSREFPSTEQMMNMIGDTEAPIINNSYNNLTLDFDRNGKIIKEKKSWQQKR